MPTWGQIIKQTNTGRKFSNKQTQKTLHTHKQTQNTSQCIYICFCLNTQSNNINRWFHPKSPTTGDFHTKLQHYQQAAVNAVNYEIPQNSRPLHNNSHPLKDTYITVTSQSNRESTCSPSLIDATLIQTTSHYGNVRSQTFPVIAAKLGPWRFCEIIGAKLSHAHKCFPASPKQLLTVETFIHRDSPRGCINTSWNIWDPAT